MPIKTQKVTSKNYKFSFRAPILLYTLNKIIKAISSWVFLIIGLIIPLAIVGSLSNFLNMRLETVSNVTTDVIRAEYVSLNNQIITILYGFFISFLILLSYSKASQIFRDEISDGTLLIFNTLPMTRTRLVTEKILAFHITIITYIIICLGLPILITPLFFKFLPFIFMGQFANNIFILIGVLILLQFLISSPALLLSLVFSSKVLILFAALFLGLIQIFGLVDTFISPVAAGSNLFQRQSEWDEDFKLIPDFRKLLLLSDAELEKSGINEWKNAINKYAQDNGGEVGYNYFDYSNAIEPWKETNFQLAVDNTNNISNPYNINYKQMFNIILKYKIFNKITRVRDDSQEFNKVMGYWFAIKFDEWRKLLGQKIPPFTVTMGKIATAISYLNVVKHWQLLVSPALNDNNINRINTNKNIGFVKNADSSYSYRPDITREIINIPGAYVFYILLTISVIFGTWWVFKNKDFT